MSDLSPIKQKLQAYRRKYYLNQMIRGALLLTLLFVSLFVLIVWSESVFWLSTGWRTVLFWGLVASALGVVGWFVAIPGAKYLNLSRGLSDDHAARLIGKHFPNVSDKLNNLLELSSRSDNDNALLRAAIDQKTEELQPVPFAQAVNFKPNRKLARYAAIPVLALFFLLIFQFEGISESTERLINYDKHYNPPPPFELSIPDHKAKLVDGSSHTVGINVRGDQLPGELYMYIKREKDIEYQRYPLKKKNAAKYAYTFKNVHQDFEYYVGNAQHGSSALSTTILKRPAIGSFQIVLDYPAYTGKRTDTLAPNIGDFTAIYGTQASWMFNFKGPVKSAAFIGQNKGKIDVKGGEAGAMGGFGTTVKEPGSYSVRLRSDAGIHNIDTVRYNIKVEADKYPSIRLEAPGYQTMLPNSGIVPLAADVSDDFGFSRAQLHYRYLKSNATNKTSNAYRVERLPLDADGNFGRIESPLDFIELGAAQGDEIEFFVRIYDNDPYNGPKFADSGPRKITYTSINDQYDEMDDMASKLDEDLQEMLQKTQQNREKVKDLQEKLLNKQNLSYEDKQQMQELMQQEEQNDKQLDEMSEQIEEQRELAEQNELLTEDARKKLEQLKKLVDDIKDPNLMKKLNAMKKRMEQKNKQTMQRDLESLEEQQKRMEESIERTMELFKQMKVDQKTQELIKKLDDMQERQEKLNEQLEDADSQEAQNELSEKQQELEQEMEDIKKDLDELEDLKNDTETPDDGAMDDLKQDAGDTQEEMNDASQQMQQGKKSKANNAQKNASDKMQDMKEQLSQMQMDSQMQQQAENIEDLRNLLENLLTVSFDQEDLRDEMKGTRQNDPSLKQRTRDQNKIRDDMRMVEDSLVALAKRAIEIEQVVMDELGNINNAMSRSMQYLDQKQVPATNAMQSKVMMHTNNLANMLTESLDQMQQAMMQMQGKDGKACKNPKSGGPPNMQKLGQMQQQLNKKLQQMMNGMKPGKSQGELQKMAEEQEAIRKQLKEMFEKLRQQGGEQQGGFGDMGKVGEQMKESEQELRNQELTKELLARQQQILSRMLDFDKAMRQREYDNKRKGKTARDLDKTPPAELTREELEKRIREEQISRSKFQYSPSYRKLIDDYYRLLDE